MVKDIKWACGVLHLDVNSLTVEKVKQAYYEQSLMNHPDKNNNPKSGEWMRDVNEAKEILLEYLSKPGTEENVNDEGFHGHQRDYDNFNRYNSSDAWEDKPHKDKERNKWAILAIIHLITPIISAVILIPLLMIIKFAMPTFLSNKPPSPDPSAFFYVLLIYAFIFFIILLKVLEGKSLTEFYMICRYGNSREVDKYWRSL